MSTGFPNEARELAAVAERARPQPLSALEMIVHVAAQACGTEAAALYFTEPRLRWLSASSGLDKNRSRTEVESLLLDLAFDDEFLFNRADDCPAFPLVPLVGGGSVIESCAATLIPARGTASLGMMFVLDHRPDRLTGECLPRLREMATIAGILVDGWLSGGWDGSDARLSELRYNELFDNAAEFVFIQNLVGELTEVNRAGEQLLGYRREDLVGRLTSDFVAEEHESAVRMMALEQFGGGCPRLHEVRFISRQGKEIPLEVTSHLLFKGGRPVGVMGFAREPDREPTTATGDLDGPQPPASLAKVSEAIEILRQLNETVYDQLNRVFSDHLHAGCRILGVEIGMIGEFENGQVQIRAASAHADAPHIGKTLTVKGTRLGASVRFRKTRKYSTNKPRSHQAIHLPGVAGFFVSIPIILGGRLWGLAAFASREPMPDVTDQQIAAAELVARSLAQKLVESVLSRREQVSRDRKKVLDADRDRVTGLPSAKSIRHTFEESMEFARRGHGQIAAVLIDLDRFRRYNDALGYGIGDRLLRRVGDRLRRCLGRGGVVGHIDADRYMCILHRLEDQSEANRKARRMLAAIRRPFSVAGMELFVTASLGVSVYPKDGDAASSLLWNAEAALHQAKADGRNRLAFYAPQRKPVGVRVREIAQALRQAVERDEFDLRFQPQVDMESNLRRMEVLLSWHHDRLGRVPPEQFIPIAEETGLIVPIGAWVLRRACRQGAAWRRRGLPQVKLAVNVSAHQFAQADFPDLVASALADGALPPSLLELEITESVVMRDIHQSAKVMTELQTLGVEIAIDDFGTGYSSLSYLRRLPANALKIDRSFLEDSDSATSTRALIETIVRLAHGLGLSVVGEGVETPEQFDLLRKAGCDRAQGHLFGCPLSTRKATRLLRDSHASGSNRRRTRLSRAKGTAAQSE